MTNSDRSVPLNIILFSVSNVARDSSNAETLIKRSINADAFSALFISFLSTSNGGADLFI